MNQKTKFADLLRGAGMSLLYGNQERI